MLFFFFFVQGRNKRGGKGGQSLGGSLGSHGGDTVLLEVGGHGGVAGQSLTGAFQASLPVNDPGPGAGYRVHRQPFGLLATEVGVVVLEHSGDVVQEVVEKLRDALVP